MRGNCSAGTLGSQTVPGTRSISATSPPPARDVHHGVPGYHRYARPVLPQAQPPAMKSCWTASSAMAAPDFQGSCWRFLGQTVGAVDLAPFLPEAAAAHAFHQAVGSWRFPLADPNASFTQVHASEDHERLGAPLSLGCDHFCNPAACARRDGLALGPPPTGA